MSIKPILPKEYDRSVNLRSYYCFVREGEAYLKDGKVHDERQLRILVYYLEGKAYNFYVQKVALEDPKNLNLHKFFMELYNYRFLIDYKQRTRQKLEKVHQGSDPRVSVRATCKLRGDEDSRESGQSIKTKQSS